MIVAITIHLACYWCSSLFVGCNTISLNTFPYLYLNFFIIVRPSSFIQQLDLCKQINDIIFLYSLLTITSNLSALFSYSCFIFVLCLCFDSLEHWRIFKEIWNNYKSDLSSSEIDLNNIKCMRIKNLKGSSMISLRLIIYCLKLALFSISICHSYIV